MTMINKGLYFLGEHSLVVLCFHQIEMRVFPWSIVKHILEVINMIEYFNCVVIIVRVILCTICTVGFVYIEKTVKNNENELFKMLFTKDAVRRSR